jgi:hypothetical protein
MIKQTIVESYVGKSCFFYKDEILLKLAEVDVVAEYFC